MTSKVAPSKYIEPSSWKPWKCNGFRCDCFWFGRHASDAFFPYTHSYLFVVNHLIYYTVRWGLTFQRFVRFFFSMTLNIRSLKWDRLIFRTRYSWLSDFVSQILVQHLQLFQSLIHFAIHETSWAIFLIANIIFREKEWWARSGLEETSWINMI